MSPLLLFNFSVLLLLHSPYKVLSLENLNEKIKQIIVKLEHDPIILKGNRADLSSQELVSLVHKLKQLQHTAYEVSMFECANVHSRLLQPTQKAIRYCKQLLNQTDRFKRPANAQLLDSLLIRMRSIIVALPKEFGTFLVELELDPSAAEWSKQEGLTKVGQKIDKIATVLKQNATYCDEAHFERAKAGLAELLERDGSYTVDEQQVQQAIAEFILELKLSILETELTDKIAAFTNPCIYGKEFKQLSQAINYNLEKFGDIVEAWPKALKENFQKKLYKFVQFAREQSEPLKQTFLHKLDAIFSKSKTAFEALKQNVYEWKKGAATQSPEAQQKKVRQIIWQTKQILADLSLDMQNIGIPRHDIDGTLTFFEREAKELQKIGHVEVFDQNIKIVQEEIESEKQEINGTFKF